MGPVNAILLQRNIHGAMRRAFSVDDLAILRVQ
jgi:hypothetical protein